MDDLLNLKQAAHLVGKSTATIRRYVRSGKLDRHEGVQDGSGGSAPVMVSQAQLLALLGSNQKLQVGHDVDSRGVQVNKNIPVQVSTEQAVRIATLEGEVNTLTARLNASEKALEAERDALGSLVRELKQSLHEARSERDDWRERADAKDAQLQALKGKGWFARLLTGPTS